ncbi:hypothetical protein WR25_26355 [Diploscapter pachys]|uniref:Uncharacterized protein n=1 Tax=Diploscapter pachys TaxID=2018661 RepID=A0A2A2JJN8_9BILA|nr:hypothetical protein WR25_26355 [Diploscapter pachys]
MSEHAYNHMEQTHLFLCPICDIGAQSRETVQKHIKEFHPSAPDKAVDNRLKHAQEIKDTIKECYPEYFVDNPIPTAAEIDKMLASIKGGSDLRKFVAGLEDLPETKLEDESTDSKMDQDSSGDEENEHDDDIEDEEMREESEIGNHNEDGTGIELEEEAEED